MVGHSLGHSDKMSVVVLAIVLGVFPFSTLATDTVQELNISQYVGRWYEVRF